MIFLEKVVFFLNMKSLKQINNNTNTKILFSFLISKFTEKKIIQNIYYIYSLPLGSFLKKKIKKSRNQSVENEFKKHKY